jgi:hypothetical protein
MASWSFVARASLDSTARVGIRVAPRRECTQRLPHLDHEATLIRGASGDGHPSLDNEDTLIRGAAAVACRRRAAARRMPARLIESGASPATNTRAAHFSVDGVRRAAAWTAPAPSIEK